MKIPDRVKNVLGQTFGNQKCVEFTGKQSSTKNYIWKWECLRCGNIREEASGGIIHRKPKYCRSCAKDSTVKHGHNVGGSNTRTYRIYIKMLSRAHWKYEEYKDLYGDVSVCDRWVGSDGFKNFLEDMGDCPDNKHSLNRLQGSKVYSKDTCEWATSTKQAYDKRLHPRNKTGVVGVVWRGEPRNVWQAHMKVEGKWSRYYYGDSYDQAVTCRVVAELMSFDFSRTLEDFATNGINEKCSANKLDIDFWNHATTLHKESRHAEILTILMGRIVRESIDYKQDFSSLKNRINELNNH